MKLIEIWQGTPAERDAQRQKTDLLRRVTLSDSDRRRIDQLDKSLQPRTTRRRVVGGLGIVSLLGVLGTVVAPRVRPSDPIPATRSTKDEIKITYPELLGKEYKEDTITTESGSTIVLLNLTDTKIDVKAATAVYNSIERLTQGDGSRKASYPALGQGIELGYYKGEKRRVVFFIGKDEPSPKWWGGDGTGDNGIRLPGITINGKVIAYTYRHMGDEAATVIRVIKEEDFKLIKTENNFLLGVNSASDLNHLSFFVEAAQATIDVRSNYNLDPATRNRITGIGQEVVANSVGQSLYTRFKNKDKQQNSYPLYVKTVAGLYMSGNLPFITLPEEDYIAQPDEVIFN